jgi:hypothetical protein
MASASGFPQMLWSSWGALALTLVLVGLRFAGIVLITDRDDDSEK